MNGKIKGFHRWMAMFLCVLMCVSLLPVGAASADDGVVMGLELDDDFLEDEDSSSVEFGLDLAEEPTGSEETLVSGDSGDIDAVLEDEEYVEPEALEEDDVWADLETEETEVEDASAEEAFGEHDNDEWLIPDSDFDFTVEKVGSGMKITWEPVPDVPKYQLYRLQRNTYDIETIWNVYPLSVVVRYEWADELTYTDYSVKNGYEYIYMLRCMDADGNYISRVRYLEADGTVTDTTSSTVDASAEGFVYYIYSRPVMNTPTETADGIQLSWSWTGSGLYVLLRWDEVAADWTEVTSIFNGTSYVDKSVVDGNTYTYAVVIKDAEGISYYSMPLNEFVGLSEADQAFIDLVEKDSSVVQKTFGGRVDVLSLTNCFDNTALKNYIRVTFNENPGVDHYRIERRESTGEWKSLDNSAGFEYGTDIFYDSDGNLYYDDYNINSQIVYTYRVRAVVDEDEEGKTDGYWNTVVGTCDENGKSIAYYDTPVLDSSDTEISAENGVTIWWHAVKGINVYNVLRRVADTTSPETDDTSWKVVATVYNNAQTGKISYTDETVAAGIGSVATDKVYWYSVVCRNDANNTDLSPYDPVGVAANYTRMPILVGTKVTDTGINVICRLVDNVNRYRVFRRVAGTSKWFIVDTFDASYTVDPLTPAPNVDKQNPTNVDEGYDFIDTYPASHPGIIYEYTVRCMDDADSEYISAYDKNGVSGVYYPQPNNVKAKSVLGGIQVTWDTDENAMYYRVFRRAAGSTPWAAVADVEYSANGLYVDSSKGLTAGVEYEYTVKVLSYDKAESSVEAMEDSAYYYPAPTLLKLVNKADSLVLTWEAVANCSDTDYVVYRKTINAEWANVTASGTVEADNTAGTVYRFVDTDIVSGIEYWYTVACVDGADVCGYDPIGLNLTYYGNAATTAVKVKYAANGAVVTWNSVDKVSGYRVYRREMNSNWKAVADVGRGADKYGVVTYTDTSARNIGTYWYKIVCLSASGEELGYTESDAIIFYAAPILRSIQMTEKVDGSSIGSNEVAFADVDGAEYYNIYRKKGNTSKWSDPVTVSVGSGVEYKNGLLVYIDDGSDFGEDLVSRTQYTYTVAVADSSGAELSDKNGTGLSIIFYQTPQLLQATPGTKGTTVQWRSVKGAAGYKVYRRVVEGTAYTAWKEIATVSGYAKQTYLDTGMVSGGDYEYTVRAYRGNILSGYYYDTGDVLAASYLAAPVIESIVNTSDSVQTVSWTEVSGATEYEIYQRNVTLREKFPTSPTKTVTTASADMDVTYSSNKGYQYSYQVVALKGTLRSNVSAAKNMSIYPPIQMVSVVQNGNNGNLITWKRMSGISAYRIYRQLHEDGEWKIIADYVGGYKYTDYYNMYSNPISGVPAKYKVVGLMNGQEATSLEKAGTNSTPCTYLAQPTLISAVIAANPGAPTDEIDISWYKLPNVTQYDILVKSGSSWTVAESKYEDSDPDGDGILHYTYATSPKATYTFSVRAADSTGTNDLLKAKPTSSYAVSTYNTSGVRFTIYEAPTISSVTKLTDEDGDMTGARITWSKTGSQYALYVRDPYATEAGDGWHLLAYTNQTSYDNIIYDWNQVLPEYEYRVAVYNGIVLSSYSSAKSIS
ncbi:MAG: hypothetical protein K6C08_13885 [Oscillospiraceae bacterium]|nr:hypothetical protein [Oscillospiraceae bacterium]